MESIYRIIALGIIVFILSSMLPILIPLVIVLVLVLMIYVRIKARKMYKNQDMNHSSDEYQSSNDVIDVEYTIKEEKENDLS